MIRSPVATIAAYTLVEALRNRLLWLIGAFIVATVVLVEFTGEVAITEAAAFQSGFMGAVLRVCSVVLISLFVITSVVREFDDKVVELTLSLPLTRSSFYLGKLLGFSAVALCMALICGLCLLVYAPVGQVALWSVSLALELSLITALSLLCLFTFSQVTAALCAVLVFYVLARTIATFQLIAASPLVGGAGLSSSLIEGSLYVMSLLLPGLDRFTSSRWLIYHDGSWTELAPLLGQTFVYLALLSAAALFDLHRKNF
ncbi:MAG: ABC transporter permease subunit [Gammaproteobacteria bacterium]